jgi:hypothetical protein
MPRDLEHKTQDVSLSEKGLEGSYRHLKLRCAALQEHEDQRGMEWVADVPTKIWSAQTANAAVAQFGGVFFSQQLWSLDVKRAALHALLKACKQFPTADTRTWTVMLEKLESK